MYEFDFSSLGSAIASFINLVAGILRLDPEAINAVYTQEWGILMAVAILILGGISLGLGQSVILFVNRVRRRRFALRLILGGVVLLLIVAFWSGFVWLLLTLIFDTQISYPDLLLGAAISLAPLLFGFFVLIPYIGVVIFTLLRIWVLLIYIVVIDTITDIGYWYAMGISIAGWLLLELALRFPPLRIERLRNWYWRLSTGTQTRLKVDEMVHNFVTEMRNAIGFYDDNPGEGPE